MSTVTLNASAVPGTVILPFTGTVRVPANGRITVDQRDVLVCLGMGMLYVNSSSRVQSFTTPIAATAGRLVASTSLANGTLSVANQPDVPRLGALRVDPGTSAITAGNVAIDYYANTGDRYTDNISLVMPATTPVTTNTTYGVVILNSVIVTALAGGASPKIQLNNTNVLALEVNPGFASFSVFREETDGTNGTIGTVSSTAAGITPSTAPNGTHSYSFFHKFTS
jgi:hypothetical protein